MKTLNLIKFDVERTIRKIIFVLFLTFAVLMVGCADKPQIITRIEQKEVFVPVKCGVNLPPKPEFDDTNPQSAGELGAYYKQVEELLKGCVSE